MQLPDDICKKVMVEVQKLIDQQRRQKQHQDIEKRREGTSLLNV